MSVWNGAFSAKGRGGVSRWLMIISSMNGVNDHWLISVWWWMLSKCRLRAKRSAMIRSFRFSGCAFLWTIHKFPFMRSPPTAAYQMASSLNAYCPLLLVALSFATSFTSVRISIPLYVPITTLSRNIRIWLEKKLKLLIFRLDITPFM